MKLVLVGGGGVRSPLFVMSLLNWQKRIGVDELCLMDIDARKLDLFGAVCRQIVKRAGDPFKITTTLDARAAFEGAQSSLPPRCRACRQHRDTAARSEEILLAGR